VGERVLLYKLSEHTTLGSSNRSSPRLRTRNLTQARITPAPA